MKNSLEFSSHNILLGGGIRTQPEKKFLLNEEQRCRAIIRTLNECFGNEQRSKIKIVDLGCLEGGYAVEFARHGFDVLGIEVREENVKKCNFVSQNLALPNLKFIKDDARNVRRYGRFDAVFSAGFYITWISQLLF